MSEWKNLYDSLKGGALNNSEILNLQDILWLDNLAYFRPIEQGDYNGRSVEKYLDDCFKLSAYELLSQLDKEERNLYGPKNPDDKWVLPFGGSDADIKFMLEGITSSTSIGGLTVIHTRDDGPANGNSDGGVTAMCLMDANNNIYVIYRGTSGGEAWKDNIMAMTEVESDLQKEAYKFYKESIALAQSQGVIGQVIVSGHSKGGNLAKYVTIRAEDDILNGRGSTTREVDACVSFDGQGFSQEFLDTYGEAIERKAGVVLDLRAQSDFVSPLGLGFDKIVGDFPHPFFEVSPSVFKQNHFPDII